MGGEATKGAHLTVDNVEYRYRRSSVPVLNRTDATFAPGLTVLLGPNGAGKTTLLRVIATLIKPLSGTVKFGNSNDCVGLESKPQEFRKLIGFMPQDPVFVNGLTAHEHLLYCSWLSGSTVQGLATTWLRRVGLEDVSDRLTSKLSGGMKRRLAVASAVISDPPILLLDEPSVGLDPSQRARFRETLMKLKDDRIVIMSTHQVDDLLGLVDSVAIMSDGRIIFHDSFDSLLAHGRPEGDLVYRVESAYTAVLDALQR